MSFAVKDRIRETTTTSSTGAVTLSGAVTGFRSFADIGNGNTTYYCIAGQGTSEWEVGIGTYTASGTTLARTTVLSNSAGTTSPINFSSGTKDVFCTFPSSASSTTLDVIATLRSATIATYPSSIVYIEGYSSVSGGGGGFFNYVSTDTTSTDNGGTIIVDASSRRWYRQVGEPYVDVRWFGYVADNSTNNATAINNAIATLITTGGTVYFPKGTGVSTSTITVNYPTGIFSLTFVGEGADNTTIAFNGCAGFVINAQDAGNSVHFRDMTVTTNAAGTYAGITVNNSVQLGVYAQSDFTRVNLRGNSNSLTNYWQAAFNILGMSNINFDECTIYGNAAGTGGVGIGVAGVAAGTNKYGVVYNISKCSLMNLGIGINYGTYVQGVTVTQTNIVNGTTGINLSSGSVGAAELTVSGCNFNTTANQIFLNASIATLLITNNSFYVATSTNGVYIVGGSGVSITNNNFIPNGAATSTTGVNVAGTAQGVITSNTFGNSGGTITTAINLSGTTTGFVVADNAYTSVTTKVSTPGSNAIREPSGTSSQLLANDGNGGLSNVTIGTNLTYSAGTLSATGGSGSPAGSTTQVQYNNSGAFAGSANLIFDGSSLAVSTGASIPTWGTGWKAVLVNNGNIASAGIGDLRLMSNMTYNGTNFIYTASGAASAYSQVTGAHYWTTVTAGTAGGTVTAYNTMVLDANGSLAVNYPNQTLGFSDTGILASFTSSVSGSYNQIITQNKSATAGASSAIVVANDSTTSTTFFGEFGINSSAFSATTPSNYFGINNAAYASSTSGDLVLGSTNGFKTYLTWGTAGQSAHVINASGAIGLNTALGTTPALSGLTNFGSAGQVLTSQGSAATPTWTNAGSGTVTGVTGTAPVVSSGGTAPAISMAAATTSVNGYLTSTDWNTFNGKQASLVSGTNIKTVGGASLVGAGDVGVIGGTYGGTGVNNGASTITVAGNLSHAGAFTQTFTATANTSVTLPTSGTLIASVTAPTANPVTGTPSSTTYLRGDGTWSTVTATATPAGSTTQIQYNNAGALGASSNMTFDGTGISSGYYTTTSSTAPVNGVYLPATNSVGISTNSTKRVTIDASGNVGIGVTPSAWTTGSQVQALQLGTNGVASVFGFTDQMCSMNYNSYYNGTNYIYISGASNYATQYAQLSGLHLWYNAPVGAAGATATMTERMRMDTSGNLYINSANLWQYSPAPTSISAITTLSAAQLQTSIINTTGTSYTVTLPTASAIDTAFSGAVGTNIAFQFTIINTATGTITVAVNTGITALGGLTVATATSATFRLRRTAAATYILYRV